MRSANHTSFSEGLAASAMRCHSTYPACTQVELARRASKRSSALPRWRVGLLSPPMSDLRSSGVVYSCRGNSALRVGGGVREGESGICVGGGGVVGWGGEQVGKWASPDRGLVSGEAVPVSGGVPDRWGLCCDGGANE